MVRNRDLSHLPSQFFGFDLDDILCLTPLHRAVFQLDPKGNLKEQSLFSEINATDVYGRSALWWAVYCQNWDATKLLLRHGASASLTDNEGVPPFFPAFSSDSIEMDVVDLMLAQGININHIDKVGRNILHRIGTYSNRQDVIERLIPLRPNVNLVDYGSNTPLWNACRYDNYRVCKVLLQSGADANHLNMRRWVPLVRCMDCKAYRSLEILLNHGIKLRNTGEDNAILLETLCHWSDIRTLNILSAHGFGKHLETIVKDRQGSGIFKAIVGRITSEKALNAILRVIASGHCSQCTSDAAAGILAKDGGCPHGTLAALSLQTYVNATYRRLERDIERHDHECEELGTGSMVCEKEREKLHNQSEDEDEDEFFDAQQEQE